MDHQQLHLKANTEQEDYIATKNDFAQINIKITHSQ